MHITISDRNTEIHHYEYRTYEVRWCSGWGILCRGSDQWLPAHCEACTLLVPYLLCFICCVLEYLWWPVYTCPCEAFTLLVLDLLVMFPLLECCRWPVVTYPLLACTLFVEDLLCFVLFLCQPITRLGSSIIFTFDCLFVSFFVCFFSLFVYSFVSCLLVWENGWSSDQSSNCQLVTMPALVCCCINGWT